MQIQTFRDRLDHLIKHLGVDQTEMGRRLGVSRNMISMLLRKDKEQNPSKAVTLLFEQEWQSAFGQTTSMAERKLPLSGSFPSESSSVSEEPAVYAATRSTDATFKALHGCDAVYDLLHRATSPQELGFVIASFDRAWNAYKHAVENTRLQLPQKRAESDDEPCKKTPASSAVSAPPDPHTTPLANLVQMPPQHFMSVEEALAKGVSIPKELLDQLIPKPQPGRDAARKRDSRNKA